MAKKISKIKFKNILVAFKSPKFIKSAKIGLLVIFIFSVAYLGKSLVVSAIVGRTPVFTWTLNKKVNSLYRQNVLNALIERTLVKNEAKKQGISVTDDEVNTEIDRIKSQIEATGGDLDSYLAMNGESYNDFVEDVSYNVIVEKLLLPKINISDQDIQDYFDQNTDLFDPGTKLEDVKDQIVQNLQYQQMQQQYSTLVSQLQANAKIITFVKN